MRLKKLILLLVTLLLLPGTALANPQEQFILQEIKVGHFDVWQHTDGTWQDTDHDGEVDPYGLKDKKVPEPPYTYPDSQYANQFTPTRVEITKITQASNLTDEELKKAGRSETWRVFNENYLTKLPNAYSAAKTSEDIAQGTVSVEKTFDLMPELLDLKDPTVRAELGMTDRDFSDMAQGWRWYTPVLIKWYGVPKVVVQPPDFSVTLDRYEFKDMNPGDKITLTATFKLNENHPQPERAKLGAFHVTGTEYTATMVPVEPSDALDSNGIIKFNPGETKQYRITVTVSTRNSVVQAKIWPADTTIDANWTNNRAEAQIRLNQNLWTEPISNTNLETREGNSVNVTARIHNDSGSMIVTRVIWTLDGKVIKDIKDFDVISQGDSSITVTPGVGEHNLTVEVNPDRNKPVNEATFADNKTTYTINVAPQREEASGNIQIIGPDVWDCYKEQKLYSFTVKISGYLPYERYRDRDGNVRYRSKTYNMTVKTSGEGVETYQWTPNNQFGNPQLTRPVVKSWSEGYSASSGSFTKSFHYVFPYVGMRGFSDSTLVIEATDSRFGTARKVVTIKPTPVKIPEYKLTL
ncbi:hypothetical protein [Desulfallas thermosapovorans]|uniref:CARDB protein n=1 Tax=Desulfallas thermosapovorans DSM 6562 TaxID=1121431 RepID=A0A5S4ZPG2_9FIRM|nr:hypothetical protein [Desulfallas thermosapovorans]TYO94523.1 hypothetical protein LX24_02359 [Desulfallas thermosapovorans DSM 6562]